MLRLTFLYLLRTLVLPTTAHKAEAAGRCLSSIHHSSSDVSMGLLQSKVKERLLRMSTIAQTLAWDKTSDNTRSKARNKSVITLTNPSVSESVARSGRVMVQGTKSVSISSNSRSANTSALATAYISGRVSGSFSSPTTTEVPISFLSPLSLFLSTLSSLLYSVFPRLYPSTSLLSTTSVGKKSTWLCNARILWRQ